jgi:endonuclease G
VDRTPLAGYGYLRLLEDTGKISRSEYATIIQHPNGRQKHLASRNNRITVYVYDDDLAPEARATNNFLYYSTDTLKGSSGSPVFSDQWFVVALHRRGVPETKVVNGRTVIMRTNGQPAAADDPEEVIKYTSNEGVRISRVVQRLATVAETPADQRQPMAQQALDMVREAAGRIHDGPFSIPTAPLALLLEAPGQLQAQSSEEIVHRNTGAFPDNLGYQENFLAGHPLPLPVPSVALRKELAPRIDKPQEFLLPFRHFTTVMHARRRLPVFAAVNISGAQKPEGGMGARPQWSYDPRIDEVHQPDDTIFSDMLQRGHMAARDYVVWGAADELRQADLHSFTLTNVCPQVREFNAHREWYEVERQVATGAEEEGRRITEFVGPILRSTDPSYDDLRGTRSRATRGTGIRVPLRFWKIVVWVEEGALQHRAFILDQEAELTAAEPLEFDVTAPAGVTATTVQEIEALTDLRFQGL